MNVRALERVRNIGIIAHIDAGKTTVTERLINYAGVTHKIGEVHNGEAAMDFRADERERGITIAAAATSFDWGDYHLNLIDTPGHVDFTAEVERSLRVLDGAVVVFSGVEGVEPQSETVWRQADRYRVPRLAFINKLDRIGADHERVIEDIRSTLGAHALFVNMPHGLEDKLDGVIDLIGERWLVFDPDSKGKEYTVDEIPEDAREAASAQREALIEGVAESVEWLADKFLADEPISNEELCGAIREATLSGSLVPVLCGSALKNLGIRPVLDAVCDFLPAPNEVPSPTGLLPDGETRDTREASPDAPFSALVFKVIAAPNTDYYWLRVYSGSLGKEERCYNPRTKTRLRLRQLQRIQIDRFEPVSAIRVGDIVAAPALKDVQMGDTLTDPDHPLNYEAIVFPETVVSVAVEARTATDREKMLEVVERLSKEDPTFRCHTDEDTGQLILSGMGELHLDVLRNRMERDFGVNARFGRPRVSYRERVAGEGSGEGHFDKKIGEVNVTGRARVRVEPRPRVAGDRSVPPVEVELGTHASLFPEEVRHEIEQVLIGGCEAGGTFGYPVVDTKVIVDELVVGDAPDPLVPISASLSIALRHALEDAGTAMLEPIMRLEVRVPEPSLGAVVKDLSSRRAEIRETTVAAGNLTVVRGLAPLAEMFGYSTGLRSLSQGRGNFSLEPFDYAPMPEGAGPEIAY